MSALATELIEHADEIVARWCKLWRRSPRLHPELSETALKDNLPLQLRVVGEQLRELSRAEDPEQMWKVAERLDPEQRVTQDFSIEEVVQEYRFAVDAVRDWIEERRIDVPFCEYSYFHAAIFELAAESVRRYAKHQAERVRHDRAQYLAAVMHQLRAPLAAMEVQVELMSCTGDAPDAAAVARLRRNVRRVNTMVENILRLERFRPSEVPVRTEDVCPADLVDAVMSDHAGRAAQKGLRLEAHVDRSLRMTLDPELFVHALENLVQNAVKYTSEGFVIVEAEERREDVCFRVRDSGPGIAPEQQRTIFKQPQPGNAGGAGIGLQIAQHAAEAQGGWIEMQSDVGRGSVFSLCVPRLIRPRAGGPPAAG